MFQTSMWSFKETLKNHTMKWNRTFCKRRSTLRGNNSYILLVSNLSKKKQMPWSQAHSRWFLLPPSTLFPPMHAWKIKWIIRVRLATEKGFYIRQRQSCRLNGLLAMSMYALFLFLDNWNRVSDKGKYTNGMNKGNYTNDMNNEIWMFILTITTGR